MLFEKKKLCCTENLPILSVDFIIAWFSGIILTLSISWDLEQHTSGINIRNYSALNIFNFICINRDWIYFLIYPILFSRYLKLLLFLFLTLLVLLVNYLSIYLIFWLVCKDFANGRELLALALQLHGPSSALLKDCSATCHRNNSWTYFLLFEKKSMSDNIKANMIW